MFDVHEILSGLRNKCAFDVKSILDNIRINPSEQQKIAAELGKPATAFVVPLSEGPEVGDRFGISWHSPVTELPLCGHGTMAAAAAVFEESGHRRTVAFETKRGVTLRADPKGDSGIELRFPTNPPSAGWPDYI